MKAIDDLYRRIVQRVQPDSLTFLGSKELFDQYDWSEE